MNWGMQCEFDPVTTHLFAERGFRLTPTSKLCIAGTKVSLRFDMLVWTSTQCTPHTNRKWDMFVRKWDLEFDPRLVGGT